MATDLDRAREHLDALDHLSRRIVALTHLTLAISTVAILLAAWGLSTGKHIGWWAFVLFLGCIGLATDSRRLSFEEGRMAERKAMWFWDEFAQTDTRDDARDDDGAWF